MDQAQKRVDRFGSSLTLAQGKVSVMSSRHDPQLGKDSKLFEGCVAHTKRMDRVRVRVATGIQNQLC